MLALEGNLREAGTAGGAARQVRVGEKLEEDVDEEPPQRYRQRCIDYFASS